MSMWSDEQFDRVARRLDGEQILLTETERQLADDFKNSERVLGDAPRVPLPAKADQRASRRIASALRGVRILKRMRLAFMSGVSAAAAIVIALGLINLMTTGSILSDYDSLAWLFDGGEQSRNVWRMPEQDPQLELLAGDLDEIETALFSPEPTPLPIEAPAIEDIDGDLDELWRIWVEEHPGETDSSGDVTSG